MTKLLEADVTRMNARSSEFIQLVLDGGIDEASFDASDEGDDYMVSKLDEQNVGFVLWLSGDSTCLTYTAPKNTPYIVDLPFVLDWEDKLKAMYMVALNSLTAVMSESGLDDCARVWDDVKGSTGLDLEMADPLYGQPRYIVATTSAITDFSPEDAEYLLTCQQILVWLVDTQLRKLSDTLVFATSSMVQ